MTQDNTRPSVKHALGKTVGTWPAWWTLSIAAGAAIFTGLPDAMDHSAKPLEHPGTEMQQSLIAEHESDFTALKEMKAQIEMLEAQASLGGENTRLTDLKTVFSEKAVSDYVDLYVQGASKDGPALSEENFDNLRRDFAENIADPATFGFKGTIQTGLLDETLAQTDFKTGSDVDRFQTAKQMDQQMGDAVKDPASPYFISAGVTAVAAFLLLMMCAGIGEWEKLPARVPRRKTKPVYGKH